MGYESALRDQRRIRRVSSAQSVASFLKQDIISGRLSAGERIYAEEVAEQMGVSRIPVREALIGMDRDGWLRTEPNRGGIFVCGFRSDDILDHYELREQSSAWWHVAPRTLHPRKTWRLCSSSTGSCGGRRTTMRSEAQ